MKYVLTSTIYVTCEIDCPSHGTGRRSKIKGFSPCPLQGAILNHAILPTYPKVVRSEHLNSQNYTRHILSLTHIIDFVIITTHYCAICEVTYDDFIRQLQVTGLMFNLYCLIILTF